jgi:hypothetical protein
VFRQKCDHAIQKEYWSISLCCLFISKTCELPEATCLVQILKSGKSEFIPALERMGTAMSLDEEGNLMRQSLCENAHWMLFVICLLLWFKSLPSAHYHRWNR